MFVEVNQCLDDLKIWKEERAKKKEQDQAELDEDDNWQEDPEYKKLIAKYENEIQENLAKGSQVFFNPQTKELCLNFEKLRHKQHNGTKLG